MAVSHSERRSARHCARKCTGRAVFLMGEEIGTGVDYAVTGASWTSSERARARHPIAEGVIAGAAAGLPSPACVPSPRS